VRTDYLYEGNRQETWRIGVEKMRIIGISGSPRAGGNTDIILQEALTAPRKEGSEVKLMRISDYRLEPCSACSACFTSKKCVIKDDCEKIYQEMLKADGVILGSPSYFQGGNGSNEDFHRQNRFPRTG
jgi:multimeric flavodoxin WrbA